MSQRDAYGVWITAAAVDKGLLTERDVSLIELDGTLLRGPQPSSEWPFHVAIYQARPDIRAIVHAHAPALVAASLLDDVPDTRLVPSCFASCGRLGKIAYVIPGSPELGTALAQVFVQGCDCVLMRNHGIVIGADSLLTAISRLEILEASTRAILTARESGKLPSGDAETVLDPGLDNRGGCRNRQPSLMPTGSLPVPTAELPIAAELVHFAERGNRWQLLQVGRGGLCARCEARPERYLATPRPCDFLAITPQQLLLYDVSGAMASDHGRLSHNLLEQPSLYQRLFRAHQDIRAIIHAHPPYASAFSLMEVDRLPVTIPESYIVLGQVRLIDPSLSADGLIEQISSAIDHQHPALILAREGVLVTGRSLLEAFDRLEVLESTAETMTYARRLGTMTPLSEQQLEQLESRRRAHLISKQRESEGPLSPDQYGR